MICRLLAKDPADRPATGAVVAAGLDMARASATGLAPAPRVTSPRARSIAVLPFANLSTDGVDDFFSDGLTDEIITDLSGLRALRVISRNSSMQRKGSTRPLPEFAGNIGRHLDAMERSRAIDPQNPVINWALGYTYALMGRAADAARQAEWMRSHAPTLPYTVQLSALVDGMDGRGEAALDALARLDLAPLDAHHTFHFAEAYATAGETARALTLLEHAVDHGMSPHRFYGEFCPFMAPLRGHPEFDRIVAKAARRAAAFEAASASRQPNGER
jgi:hypothetical protein